MTEIITAAIAAFSALITCLIKTSIDKKKMALEFEKKDQEKFQELLDKLSQREDNRAKELSKWQSSCDSILSDLKFSIKESNLQLENVEKRLSERIDNLARHVEKHNNFAERMPVVEEQIKVANHRIDDLEKNRA